MNSTLRIYQGHLQRYERWCFDQKFDPTETTTLDKYENLLKNEKKLNKSYVKSIISTILKKWFDCGDKNTIVIPSPITSTTTVAETENNDDDEINDQTSTTNNNNDNNNNTIGKKRSNRFFSKEEVYKIYNASFLNFEQDELSLLILIIMNNPDLRPAVIFQIMNNNNHERRSTVVRDNDERTKKLKEFIETGLANYSKEVFPLKHTTYLSKFKKRVNEILGHEIEGASFEMLARSLYNLKQKGEWNC